MEKTPVDRLYEEFQDLLANLDVGKQPSLYSTANDNFRKVLLIAAASYFEHRICEDIIAFVDRVSTGNRLLAAFVKNKAIDRQYHTFFQWGENNANQFFSFFGEEYKKFMQSKVKESEDLKKAVKDFIEIGEQRNLLVHENYVTFPLDKTAEEIYELYRSGLVFIEAIARSLCDSPSPS